jgi:mRNA-degrading endonuclease RelE of RelBE toxin-antitoxin system
MILVYTAQFDKSIDKLKDKIARKRLYVLLEKLMKADSLKQISNIKYLTGNENLYRIKTGDYRLIVEYNSKENKIVIHLLEYLKKDEKTYKKYK